MTEENRDLSLENLMALAQAGDKRAYNALFQKITPILKSFISRRIYSHADTEEIVQNILLSIHHASHTYDSRRPFKTWMFAIARYRLNDYLRRHYRKSRLQEISLDDMDHETSAMNVTEPHEPYEYLNEALSSLPEKQRKIVKLMKLEGYSGKETAKTMNMSVSAVKVAAHRAYKTLALRIRQDERE